MAEETMDATSGVSGDEPASSSAEAMAFSQEVGTRLRAVRRQRRMSLDDVERSSDGRWSASAIGAYERGFRNLSLPRLRELASFYDVPMTMLLGELELRDTPSRSESRVVLDLAALEAAGSDAEPVLRYARSIMLDRGDWNGRMLSLRRDDTRALASVLHLQDIDLVERLDAWGALIRDAVPGSPTDVSAAIG
jgi:transcriptional regulator with XRE-family HTH domain